VSAVSSNVKRPDPLPAVGLDRYSFLALRAGEAWTEYERWICRYETTRDERDRLQHRCARLAVRAARLEAQLLAHGIDPTEDT